MEAVKRRCHRMAAPGCSLEREESLWGLVRTCSLVSKSREEGEDAACAGCSPEEVSTAQGLGGSRQGVRGHCFPGQTRSLWGQRGHRALTALHHHPWWHNSYQAEDVSLDS